MVCARDAVLRKGSFKNLLVGFSTDWLLHRA